MAEQLKIAGAVRELRQQLDLSQEKFAVKLGVSFRTVSRWENEHAVPSPMALQLIEQISRELSDSPMDYDDALDSAGVRNRKRQRSDNQISSRKRYRDYDLGKGG